MLDKIEVIDNFLTKEDFKELSTLNLKGVNNFGKKVYHNRIFKDGSIESKVAKKLEIWLIVTK